MQFPAPRLVLAFALSCSGSLPGAALGQDRWEGACLEPIPRPATLSLPLLLPSTSPSPDSAFPPFFVSAEGRLCEAFRFTPGEEEPPEQATGNRTPKPGKAFLLSAALPGAGQWFLGQNRWPAYLAVEVWAWVQFLDWRREGHNLQRQYKDLAWLVARRISSGRRTEAGWEYYEALTKFQSSGAYDSDPLVPGIQPEVDPETFNGFIWALAQEIFLPEDPSIPVDEGSEPYEKAFEYYLSRAYAPELAWDWGANSLHRDEYRALIRDSDEALRKSTGMIGVILANHLLSAVDGLVSGRLGIADEAEPSLQVSLTPDPFYGRALTLQFRLPDPFSNVP